MTLSVWCERCGDIREYPHDCPFVAGVRKMPSAGRKSTLERIDAKTWVLIVVLVAVGSYLISGLVKGLMR